MTEAQRRVRAAVVTGVGQLLGLLGSALIGALVAGTLQPSARVDGFFAANQLFALSLYLGQAVRITAPALLVRSRLAPARLTRATALLAVLTVAVLALAALMGRLLLAPAAQPGYTRDLLLLLPAAALHVASGGLAARMAVLGSFGWASAAYAAGSVVSGILLLVFIGAGGAAAIAPCLLGGAAAVGLVMTVGFARTVGAGGGADESGLVGLAPAATLVSAGEAPAAQPSILGDLGGAGAIGRAETGRAGTSRATTGSAAAEDGAPVAGPDGGPVSDGAPVAGLDGGPASDGAPVAGLDGGPAPLAGLDGGSVSEPDGAGRPSGAGESTGAPAPRGRGAASGGAFGEPAVAGARTPGWAVRRILLGAVPALAMQGLIAAFTVSAGHVVTGGTALLSYAFLALFAFTTVAITPMSVVLGPELARRWDGAASSLLSIVGRATRLSMVVAVPIVAAGFLVGRPLAGLVLGALTPSDLDLVFAMAALLSPSLLLTAAATAATVGITTADRLDRLATALAAVFAALVASAVVLAAVDAPLLVLAAVAAAFSVAFSVATLGVAVGRRELGRPVARLVAENAPVVLPALLVTAVAYPLTRTSLPAGVVATALAVAVHAVVVRLLRRDVLSLLLGALRRRQAQAS